MHLPSTSTPPLSPVHRTGDALARWTGLALSGGAILAGTLMGGMGIGPYIDVPSVVFVFVPTVGLTVAAFGARAPVEALALLFSGDPTQDELSRAAGIAFSVGGFALGSGMLGSLIGVVQMLQNMSEPTAIGPAMAVALLTTFYAVCVALMAFTAGMRLATRTGRGDVVGATGAVGAGALAVATMVLYGPVVAVCCGTMFLAFLFM